jgi:pyruvate formate lyase activating enzyme
VSITALERVVDVIDAANVDWKGFNVEFYKKQCSAELQDVLDATEYMYKHGVHVEVTFLVIPTVNDDPKEMRQLARYLVDHLGPDVPLHLSRFFPMHKFQHLPPTPVETLIKARELSVEEGVKYVFVGNVRGGGYEDTICPKCGKPVVTRSGYSITSWHLDDENKCKYCGNMIPIVGHRELHRDSFLF